MLKYLISIFLLIFSFNASSSTKDNDIRIAGGVMGGTYYPVALQLCAIVTKYSPITKCEVVPTSGSINNLNLLSTDKVDFAFVQSDVARDATKAIGVFANQKSYRDLRLVMNLFPESFTMIVKDEKGIVNFSDLSGRNLGLNLKGSGAKSGLLTLFKYFKFQKEPQIIHVIDNQMPKKLCDDEVDSVILFTGHPSVVVSQITSTCDVEFVNIDQSKLDALTIENPVYEKIVLPAGMYKGISRNANTFSTRALLVTNKDTGAGKVNLLKKIILKYFDEFKSQYPALKELKKGEVFTSGVIPVYED